MKKTWVLFFFARFFKREMDIPWKHSPMLIKSYMSTMNIQARTRHNRPKSKLGHFKAMPNQAVMNLINYKLKNITNARHKVL